MPHKSVGIIYKHQHEPARLEAKQLVQKMQFLARLQQEAEDLEEELVASL